MAAAASVATKAGARPQVATPSPPLPPPHDLSECPKFDAAVVNTTAEVLSSVIPEALARRIARAVAADATAEERADTDVLTARLAAARAREAPWPWSGAIRYVLPDEDALNTHAPGLGLWFRVAAVQSVTDPRAQLRWTAEADRPALMCIAWACLKQGMRLNYRADGDVETPLTATASKHPHFAHALLALPPGVGRELDLNIRDRDDWSALLAAVAADAPDTELIARIGERCSDETLNFSARGVDTPLRRATVRLVQYPEVLRAVTALARVDGSGVCIADALWSEPFRRSVTRYPSPRGYFDALLAAERFPVPSEPLAAHIEEVLAEADAVCAAVRAYRNALLQSLRAALPASSPLSGLHGVLQIVESYVLTPPPSP